MDEMDGTCSTTRWIRNYKKIIDLKMKSLGQMERYYLKYIKKRINICGLNLSVSG
jgi:hypothetical protein